MCEHSTLHIGRSLLPREDRRQLTGGGEFVADSFRPSLIGERGQLGTGKRPQTRAARRAEMSPCGAGTGAPLS